MSQLEVYTLGDPAPPATSAPPPFLPVVLIAAGGASYLMGWRQLGGILAGAGVLALFASSRAAAAPTIQLVPAHEPTIPTVTPPALPPAGGAGFYQGGQFAPGSGTGAGF